MDTNVNVAPATKPEFTSEKLTAAKAKFAAAWTEMLTQTDAFSEAAMKANLAVLAAKAEINAEMGSLQKERNA